MLARISSSRAAAAGSAAGPAFSACGTAGRCGRAAELLAGHAGPDLLQPGRAGRCRGWPSGPPACGPRRSCRPVRRGPSRWRTAARSCRAPRPATGCCPARSSDDIDSSERATVSCILACSSWLSSLVRSASFCWSIIALFSTALRAWAAAPSAWSCRVFRSSMACSAETSWVANVCAVCSYSHRLGLVARRRGPGRRAPAPAGRCPAASRPRTSAGTASSPAGAGCRSPPRPAAPAPGAAAARPRWPAGSAPSGSAYSSILAPKSAIRYFQPLTNGFAISRYPLSSVAPPRPGRL